MPVSSFKQMLHTLILKERATNVYNLIYDVTNNSEIHNNYVARIP